MNMICKNRQYCHNHKIILSYKKATEGGVFLRKEAKRKTTLLPESILSSFPMRVSTVTGKDPRETPAMFPELPSENSLGLGPPTHCLFRKYCKGR